MFSCLWGCDMFVRIIAVIQGFSSAFFPTFSPFLYLARSSWLRMLHILNRKIGPKIDLFIQAVWVDN
ncbi:hypothetical protein BDV39DRAFT_44266 [Aspergillus sergii]|uniref:Uncharacterized protein n=1 Tax=Aspergillus sergii TaxID=1034303 RepID=A0A5N6WLL1_9EURO|nr:hypothetical protein BDV39DRAFT_44266 [Aspergillus sergii]